MQQLCDRSSWQLTRAERRPRQHGAACLDSALRESAQNNMNSEISKPLFRAMGFLILMVCWFCVGTGALHAQIDRGEIVGQITDPTGAVVPGAKIQVTNVNTNTSIALEANDQGLYTAANLPRGTYRVVVTREGFKTASSAAAELGASITLRIDIKLQPGLVTESVTVTDEAPILDVGTTNNATGMQSNLIEEMPVIVAGTQRAITDYLSQLPGYTGGGSFLPSANGSSTGDTEVFIDGGPASEWGIARGGVGEVSPSIEQVGEMSVVSNAFNAEYGGFGSWFTNVVLKSGTNEVHGSVYNHLGNSALNAKSYFATACHPVRTERGRLHRRRPSCTAEDLQRAQQDLLLRKPWSVLFSRGRQRHSHDNTHPQGMQRRFHRTRSEYLRSGNDGA
jgi:hypothetical protein